MSDDNQISALERLTKLRESGALSEEEFTAQKVVILGGATTTHSPFYRRLWFVVTLTCLMITFPLALLILATGNVYRKKQGALIPIKNTTRYVYAGALAVWFLAVAIRIGIDPKSISQHWAESANSDNAGQSNGQTASSASGTQTAGGSDDWALNNVGNALDGAAYAATKSFAFPNQKSRIDVSLTCTLKTRDVKIKIESYNDTPENGANAGSALVTHMSNIGPRPDGRIKIGAAETSDIEQYFSIDSYSNVISWTVLGTARDAYQSNGDINADTPVADSQQNSLAQFLNGPDAKTSLENLGAGNYLRARLPITMEIQNKGGTEQFAIPENSSSVMNVIEKCSAKNLAAFNSATAAPQPAPPPDANTLGSPPADSPQPTSP